MNSRCLVLCLSSGISLVNVVRLFVLLIRVVDNWLCRLFSVWVSCFLLVVLMIMVVGLNIFFWSSLLFFSNRFMLVLNNCGWVCCFFCGVLVRCWMLGWCFRCCSFLI